MSEHPNVRSTSSDQHRAELPERYAGLIVDALVDAGLVRREDFDVAVRIAALEISVRRSMGDQ